MSARTRARKRRLARRRKQRRTRFTTCLGDKPTKFTLFPKLPLEIRLKIWGYMEPEPLLIKLTMTEGGFYRYVRPVPALLQICQETRSEYTAQTGDSKNHITYTFCEGFGPWQEKNSLWVSLEHDIIMIDPIWPAFPKGNKIYDIKHMATIWGVTRASETTEFLKNNLSKFKHLKFPTAVRKFCQPQTLQTLVDKAEIDWKVLTEKSLWVWIERLGGV